MSKATVLYTRKCLSKNFHTMCIRTVYSTVKNTWRYYFSELSIYWKLEPLVYCTNLVTPDLTQDVSLSRIDKCKMPKKKVQNWSTLSTLILILNQIGPIEEAWERYFRQKTLPYILRHCPTIFNIAIQFLTLPYNYI